MSRTATEGVQEGLNRRSSTLVEEQQPAEEEDEVNRLESQQSRYDPEEQTPRRAPSPQLPEENAPPPAELVTKSRLISHYAVLVLASILGCLVRLGLDALGEYDGRIIFPLAWSQGVGCAVMGFALGQRSSIVCIYPPVYTFLTTGIAGSITTFSSWMLEGYESFANLQKADRGGFHNMADARAVDGVAYSFATFLISLGGLHVGSHFASLLPPLPIALSKQWSARSHLHPAADKEEEEEDERDLRQSELSNSKRQRHKVYYHRVSNPTQVLDALSILVAALSFLAALLVYFLAPAKWRHRASEAILFAPLGTMIRFALAKINTRARFQDKFPMGTFLANMIAVLIIAACFALQRRPTGMKSMVGCNTLYAVQQGFCGCLSTVSTFVVETRAIKRKRDKWIYVATSVILGHVFVLAIVGGIGWNQGYTDVCGGNR